MTGDMTTIALAGNPNCGKTTIFNALTGDCRHVGNWPGVTVERGEGAYRHDGRDIWAVDLPGLYSMDPHTPDEQVSADFLASGVADVVVSVMDAANLERSLYLASQLLELGRPLIFALNMMDLAAARHVRVDPVALAVALGCPVIPLAAWKGQGVAELRAAIAKAAESGAAPRPVLPADARTEERRYAFARETARRVSEQQGDGAVPLSDRLDRIVLSRFFGMPIFFVVMYLVFLVTVTASQPVMNWLDGALGALLVDGFRALLEGWGAPELLIVTLADGAGAGVRAVGTFLPPIFGIFACLAILENSGYMARGAFVMDKALRRIGLPGRAFLPLLVGFGCNVPGIFATRTLRERRERLLTLLINPFMSCSARLPVYTLFAMAFFPVWANAVVFSLYLIGIGMAVLTGLLLRKTLLKGEASLFVMELPAYQVPSFRAVFRHAWENLKGFLVRGGKLIVLAVTLMSLVNAVKMADGESLLEKTGKAVTPAFTPFGIAPANWPASVGLVTGLFAKESVVGTLDALYGQMGAGAGEAAADPAADDPAGGRSLMGSLRRHFQTPAAAFAYLLFVLLYSPCVAVMVAMRREAGWGWTLFSVGYQAVVAWLAAVLFYQAATWRAHPASSALWLAGCAAAAALIVAGLKWRSRP